MISDYLLKIASVCGSIETEQIERLVEILYEAYKKEKQVFIFGNGGSAATASHFCEDLGKGTLRKASDKGRFKVISLATNIPYILAWANDEGYESIFEQQLRNLGNGGDVVIGMSGSGRSENVLRAIEYANSHGMVTVGMTGFDGGELARRVSHEVHVPSFDIGMVENFHLVITHLVVQCLRKKIRHKAVFLDRDGVLNEERRDHVKCWEEFAWIPGSREALRRLRGDGFFTIVVTNQSVVGRGLLDSSALEGIHRAMVSEVEQIGGGIDGVYYCPHTPDAGCDCRKPKPGLLLKASEDFSISLRDSYVVTDTMNDVEMAKSVGCMAMLVCTGRGREEIRHQSEWRVRPDYILPDLARAVEVILNLEGSECVKKGAEGGEGER